MFYLKCHIRNFSCGSNFYDKDCEVIFGKLQSDNFAPFDYPGYCQFLSFVQEHPENFAEIEKVLHEDQLFDMSDPIRVNNFLIQGVIGNAEFTQNPEAAHMSILLKKGDEDFESSSGLPFSVLGVFIYH